MRANSSTPAILLMTTLNEDVDVLVKVADLEGAALHEYGHSLCGESTYLDSRMVARVNRAFAGPVLPPMPDMPDYAFHTVDPVYEPGWVYFVFDHSDFLEENERVASREWFNNEGPEPLKGTAREVGCYSGFDVIGFPPEFDMTQVFELINYAS